MTMVSVAVFLASVFCSFSVNAAIELRAPSPNDRAQGIPAQTTLHWSVAGENLLSNGSFEEGTNGWIMPRDATVTLRNSAYDGTNMMRTSATGEVARIINLPATQNAIMWTFGVRTSTRFNAEVQTPAGDVLKREDFANQGKPPVFDEPKLWRGAVDLSAFAGQEVRLAINILTFAGETAMDDWRVEVFPDGVEFEIYMLPSGPGSTLELLGRTRGGTWPVTNLWPDRGYLWRVDTILGEEKITGPTWSFGTRSQGTAARLEFSQLPHFVCPGKPLAFELFVRDTNGFPLGAPPNNFVIFAAADAVAAPAILITEVDFSTNAQIEIANVSAAAVDLSDWRVQLAINGEFPYNLPLPANARLAPGEIATLRRGAPGGTWPNISAGQVSWFGATPHGGVVLRDAASNIVDCVFVDRRPTNTIGWGSARIFVTPVDWRGPVLSNAVAGLTYQRVGNSDLNQAGDWIAAEPSMGQSNAGIHVSFSAGFGRIAATFDPLRQLSQTRRFATAVTFPSSQTNVFLYAQLNGVRVNSETTSSIAKTSPTFQVTDGDHCMTLAAVGEAVENAGQLPITISLGSPAQIEVVVTLRSSSTNHAQIANQITIPIGASDAIVNLTLIDNSTLEGPRTTEIIATAHGYSDASFKLAIRDDERATLTITAPEVIREGNLTEVKISSSLAPVVPMRLSIQTEPMVNLSGSVELGAHQTNVSVFVGEPDYFLQGNVRMKITARHLDWEPATAEFYYVDATVGQLGLGAAWPLAEGGARDTTVHLNAIATTNILVRLRSSNPELLSVPEQTVITIGSDYQPFKINALPADGPDGIHKVAIIATADGISSIANEYVIHVEAVDSGQIQSAGFTPEGIFKIEYIARPKWRYSLAVSGDPAGPWSLSSDLHNFELSETGGLRDFRVPRERFWLGPATLFKILREPTE